jgi:hypothetical protein
MSPNQKDDSRRLVWITRGNEQHPAYLLEEVFNGKHHVQWLSTDLQEWVLADQIHFERPITPSKKRPRTSMVETAAAARVTLSPYSTWNAKSAADHASAQLVQLPSSQEDSDVEVLLTILPPTPQQGRRTSPRRSSLQTGAFNETNMSPPQKGGHEVQPKTLFAGTPTNGIPGDDDSKPPPITTTLTRCSQDSELSSIEDSDDDGQFLVDLRSPNVAIRAKTKKETPTEQVHSSTTTACRRRSPRLACPLYTSTWPSDETKSSSLERNHNNSKVEPKTLFSPAQPENGLHADPLLVGHSLETELLLGDESSSNDSDYLVDLEESEERVLIRAKKKTKKTKTKTPEKNDSPTTACAQTNHRGPPPSPMAAPFPAIEPDQPRNSGSTAVSDTPSSLNGYSFKSSAYVQSLAEICHAISWDRRWRVGSQKQRLFAWERGDDLSVIHALAKMYEPLPPLPPLNCSCILCRDSKSAAKDQDATKLDAPSCESHSSLTSSTNEEEERSLNLYCRLFARKGPWFRVDDVFKYYAPKEMPAALSQESPIERPNAASPSKFFQPRANEISKPKISKSMEALIDQQFVERHIECLTLLLNDLGRLQRMGLIRSFQDEEECGKTVGQVQKYGLLRMEEQRQILAKLGGGSKRIAASNNGRTSPTPSNENENPIWKQMCQQQSISFLVAASDTPVQSAKAALLPVSKHVDQAILHSLVTSIVLKSSRQEYVPAAILREASAAVKEIVEPLLADHGVCRIHTDISTMCLRLREAPAQTLRRFSRLYLCATSGPGSMRGDGTNGWRSLPECHSKNLSNLPLVTNMVPPPGSHSWHSTVYPGRNFRFGLISCNFMRAHQPLVVSNELNEVSLNDQVFPDVDSFHIWEQCVELRANVDYLMELNELLLYNERRRARDNNEEPREDTAEEGESPDEAPDGGDDLSKVEDSETSGSQVDFLDLLTLSGRRKLLENFQVHTTMRRLEFDAICSRIEGNLAIFCGPDLCHLKTECEKVLAVIAVLAIHILESRNQIATVEELSLIVARPWLRHLWWEGCLAYLLWDIIPVLERRGYYAIAVKALEVLLLGRKKTNGGESTDISSIVPETLLQSERENETFLSQFFLSRRARGKGYERLMIDYVHLLRRKAKEEAIVSASEDPPKKRAKRVTTKKDAVKAPSPSDITGQLCQELLASYVSTGQITFSATRTLARRLKQPLATTLAHLNSFEARELGHRLDNEEPMLQISEDDSTVMKKYSDWTPKTDQAVANALAGEETMVGRRCSFIGFEDRDKETFDLGSLNVEQLAMEYYRTGRLPSEDDGSVRGGWAGWHDEGGRVRALFRVISSASILGMDWGCFYDKMENARAEELATVHLTPYQTAPFDLHVGAELQIDKLSESNARNGFYQRRRQAINKLLARLDNLEPQGCSDLVYESVAARLEYAALMKRNDPTLERDAQQVRTLSMLAAGLGGKQLSAIFRCFFFDYRHYSGGLPDCTLVRALYSGGEVQPEDSLVDLGDWVGEGFSPEHLAVQEARQAASIFEDRDEEFLGCNKVGDSGGRAMSRLSRSGRRQTPASSEQPIKEVVLELPPRLLLSHNDGRCIQVECMLVEVKSQNDRLDPRQEDWLNVLDRHGNARVCKFGKKTNRKKGKENFKRLGTTT